MAQTVQPHISMQNQSRRLRSAGFSLIEMLIVVVIIGIVMLFTYPKAALIIEHTAVRGARTAIVNKLNAARTAARTSNQVAVLRLVNNIVWVELNSMTSTAKTTVGGVVSLNENYRVSATGPDSIRFDPRGLMRQDDAPPPPHTFVVTRNGWSDSVVVSSYGRITR
jgi:prepilin-type N-terminal cleavage/methylation domain-containing protein